MAKIIPFRAIIYNQEKVKDLSDVVCPPYDVILPLAQERYHKRSPFNFIHILLGKDKPGDDKYLRAQNYFKSWMQENILLQDDQPAVYFYKQEYMIKGEKKSRLGFIALLHLGEKNPTAFGHEQTRREPWEDRMRLLKKIKANLSPVFATFADKKRLIPRIYQHYIEGSRPMLEITDDEKTVHRIWRLASPELIARIQAVMEPENVFIADGHHRFGVACAYRDALKKRSKRFNEHSPENFILTYFTSTDSRGLTILPIHRLVKLPKALTLEGLKSQLKENFDIEEFTDKNKFFFLFEKAGKSEQVLGAYKDGRFLLLRLKNIKILDRLIADKPKYYRGLAVLLLNRLVLEKVLKINPQEQKEQLQFSADAEALIKEVDENSSRIAFFLNPVGIQQIIAVALHGEKMPAKSTYFYPKVLSGLVINKF